ncbi:MAG TPA: PspC domain-containing protein [Lacibacter sp.]|nr:PspC domain-containing protein [Lacibacter sp.]
MKKVININFKGRVIPIEESAFEQLQKYTDSLRRYFANEEGRDEIINDIEDRIAELFNEELKKGATCITDENVATICSSMGSVEDFEQMDNETGASSSTNYSSTSSASASSSTAYATGEEPRGSLGRNANDKILGGVCSGLANYLKIDPTVVRILFALITFGGFGTGVLIYIILWVVLPLKDLKTNIRKRLFRNPDDKVIGGVASGLANYFNIPVWVPRVVFILPLILSIISSIFRNAMFDFDFEENIIFGGFGGTLFVIYVILWVVLPLASSATDKLQMRGEKIDVNSIKNAVQEELGGSGTVKEKVSQMSEEIKEGAQRVSATITEGAKQVGSEFGTKSKAFAVEAGPIARSTTSGIGHAIGILFKAFFLFIAGVFAFVLLMALIGVVIGGVAAFPFKGFFLEGTWQHVAAWGTLLFFFAVPVIALLTWVIRKIIGTKSRNPYLGYTFGFLWFVGLVCLIILVASFSNNFRVSAQEQQVVELQQPVAGKMIVKVPTSKVKIYGRSFSIDDVFTMDGDSMYINNIRLRIVKSNDSLFHVNYDKRSSGPTRDKATDNAKSIKYHVNFKDSVLSLDRGFSVSENAKFRNQRVVVTIEVPVGKRIYIDETVNRLEWHDIKFNGRGGDWEWEDEGRWHSKGWNDTDVEYVMTEDGLERVDGKDKIEKVEREEGNIEGELERIEREKKELQERENELKNKKKENDSLRYRYSPDTPKTAPAPSKQIVERISNSSESVIIQPMTINAL